ECPGCLETPCPRCPEPRHNTCHHLRKRPASWDISAMRAVSSLSRHVSPCRAVDRHVALSTDAWRTGVHAARTVSEHSLDGRYAPSAFPRTATDQRKRASVKAGGVIDETCGGAGL